jgi:hypothetical protein
LALFSSRLALRGGERAVEVTVARLRREYKVVLHLLTVYMVVVVVVVVVWQMFMYIYI